MDCTANRLPYRQTGYFSKTVLDYIDQSDSIKPFFKHPLSLKGIQQAIEARKAFPTNRKLLVDVLKKQYELVSLTPEVEKNIERLLSPDTFVVTTAHQNNIFTGPLYFIYKILHAIRLSKHLKTSLPQYNFVPVFYIGSEDADLEELNHIHLNGEKLEWKTKQTGAVGRMKIDKGLLQLIISIEGQLGVFPHGKEIVDLIKDCYKEGDDIQTATFRFVHSLFSNYGLVILLPDNALLKKQMIDVFKEDLLKQSASGIVEKTIGQLTGAGYKVQANPREINLFYLDKDKRERIERADDKWQVINTPLIFEKEELLKELEDHPEKFSPNVILRGLYQETILPGIAFVGGGGEIAYWLQLKDLFDQSHIPFPVLVVRNSFLIVERKWREKIARLNFNIADFFFSEEQLINQVVAKESKNQTNLNGSLSKVEQLYESFKQQAGTIDATLSKHVDVLKLRAVKQLQELEKKMFRAEKRKFADSRRQIQSIKSQLFPGGGLQERYENISYYYAKWGKPIIDTLYENSLSLEEEFVILEEK